MDDYVVKVIELAIKTRLRLTEVRPKPTIAELEAMLDADVPPDLTPAGEILVHVPAYTIDLAKAVVIALNVAGFEIKEKVHERSNDSLS
jgi:hypothetical protein